MQLYLDQSEEAARKAAQEEADREFEARQEFARNKGKDARKRADKTFRTVWGSILLVIFAILFIRWLM